MILKLHFKEKTPKKYIEMMELLILLEVEYFKRFLKLKIFKNINKCRSSDKNVLKDLHYVKSVPIWSFSGFKCGKIRTRKTPNKDTFHAVLLTHFVLRFQFTSIAQSIEPNRNTGTK